MSNSFQERGGLWVVCQGVLMLAVAGLGLAFPTDHHHKGWLILGIAFLISGAGFGMAGTLALKQNLTPYPKPLPQADLVRHGIYARIRHPLYTSVMSAALGWALVWQSWPSLAAAFLLWPFFAAKAQREERWLRERFTEYASYSKGTRRFIPWIY